MDTIKELILSFLGLVVIPAIPILTTYAVNLLKTKIKNEDYHKYIDYISGVVAQAVTCVAQTYVDVVKKNGDFDKESQHYAFITAKTKILQLLSDESKDFITKTYGDFDSWINSKIEQAVKELNKT